MQLAFLLFGLLLLLTPSQCSDDRSQTEDGLFAGLTELAQDGDAEAQYHLGMMYNNGIGTEKDLAKALEWFRKATAANHPLGAYKLGCYYAGQAGDVLETDPAQALKYKLIAANAGYELAQLEVGNHYAEAQDFDAAFQWWSKAADQGDAAALYYLSDFYYRGVGTQKDIAIAYAYFTLAMTLLEKASDPHAVEISDKLLGEMSAGELERAKKIIDEWKPAPTELTQDAYAGISVAQAHLRLHDTLNP